jgi:hypothetical protein
VRKTAIVYSHIAAEHGKPPRPSRKRKFVTTADELQPDIRPPALRPQSSTFVSSSTLGLSPTLAVQPVHPEGPSLGTTDHAAREEVIGVDDEHPEPHPGDMPLRDLANQLILDSDTADVEDITVETTASFVPLPEIQSASFLTWSEALQLNNLFKYPGDTLVGPSMHAFEHFWRVGSVGLHREAQTQDSIVHAERSNDSNLSTV